MGGESEEVKDVLAYSVKTYTMLSPRVLRVAANLQALVVSIRLHTTASVIENGKKLLLASDEDANCQMTFHSSWLRHNCCCSLCLTSSGQKTISHDCLSGDLKVSSANVEGDNLVLSWDNNIGNNHSGFLPIQWLKGQDYSDQDFLSKKQASTEPIVTDHLPRISYEEVMSSEEGLWSWLKNLNHYGMCLVYDGPVEYGTSQKLGREISHLQETIYGQSFAVKTVEDPINIAYSSLDLPLHMDLSYYQSSPGLQLLYCVRFDDCINGGESILLDTYPVVEEMRKTHPKHFETLTRVPATFQKIHYERESPVDMVFQRPHIAVNCYNRVIGVHWAPAFEGPLQVPNEDVEDYYEAYTLLGKLFKESRHTLKHKLREGEALTFNNHRILHGRLPFDLRGGERSLEGVYVHIDEFKSKFRVLSRKLGKTDETAKHVFNECWSA